MKKWLALLLAAVMVLSLAACTQNDGSDNGDDTKAPETTAKTETTAKPTEETPAPDDISAEEVEGDEYLGKSTDFTYMISNGISNTTIFSEYEDAPVLDYVLQTEWDPDGNGNTRKITLDVWAPPASSEADYANTLLSTGEYPDVMNIQVANMTAYEMYEDGMSLDITDYVMKYMPNYRSFFERHPEYAGRETCIVDGERRYLCIYQLDEVAPGAWGGMMYRRDWIVKYGKDADGNSFSGEWLEDGNWTDNVVFPSGETFPKYVSDWEWMLAIFQEALAAEGISDGYAYSVAASGENGVGGDMESGFGATGMWYIDPEEGKVVYGAVKDGFRTYLECMNTWYQNGWINPSFYERAGEMFYLVDSGSVYSGKVGAWYGLTSQLGGAMQNEQIPWTNGIVVFAAPTPINDVYGDESCQNITPFAYYATGQFGGQIVITDKAADKDLPALFTFLDHFYDQKSGAIQATYGLSKEEVEDAKTVAPAAYERYVKMGLENGAYSITEEGKILKDPSYYPEDNNDIGGSTALVRFSKLTVESNLDRGYLPYYKEQMDLYRLYDAGPASIGNEISAQLTPDQSSHFSEVYTNISTYTNQAVPEFITGELDIHDDAAWQEFCDTLESYDYQSYCDDLNGVLGVN